jgi:hypothetical protein
MQGQPDLAQIVLALCAAGRFAHFLDCRQKQTGRDQQDGDHHQDLNQGHARPSHGGYSPMHSLLSLISKFQLNRPVRAK